MFTWYGRLAGIAFFILTAVTGCYSIPKNDTRHSFSLQITSQLPSGIGYIPFDPKIDFSEIIEKNKLPGVLNPNSIRVVDVQSKQEILFDRTEDFAYGDSGRISWIIKDTNHTEYEVSFETAPIRPELQMQNYTPIIGVGDLLRYNSDKGGPVMLAYSTKLIDLTGDGKQDLVGTWNYAHDPAYPWDGIFCYPGVGSNGEFSDLVRLRYVDSENSTDFHFFSYANYYMASDFADFNNDGLVDIIVAYNSQPYLSVYLNSGKKDAAGMPYFIASGKIDVPEGSGFYWVNAMDINRDGAVDIVASCSGGYLYIQNKNHKGWPFEIGETVKFQAGNRPCFYDVDKDGLLDVVSLISVDPNDPLQLQYGYKLFWQKNMGGSGLNFAEKQEIKTADTPYPENLGVSYDGKQLIISYDHFQKIGFFEPIKTSGPTTMKKLAIATSKSAIMSLSDQAAPSVCDWDDDGDWDLLVGDGFGFPKIVINNGTSERPVFAEAKVIEADGKPIRIIRNLVIGGHFWHNMGYSFPIYTDWDLDGLKDLIIPNETNRIFWFKNIGTRSEPKFGPRQQILVDGYPDSEELKKESVELAEKYTYPKQKNQPFSWRRRATVADLTGDGLDDLITQDGEENISLFERYKDDKGQLRLRKKQVLRFKNGTIINGSNIVGREQLWNFCCVCVDWDGDGLNDLVYSLSGAWGDPGGSLYWSRNSGTKATPVFENAEPLKCFGEKIYITNHGPHPWVGDMNWDGKPDILCYTEWSVYLFYTHAVFQMNKRPEFIIGPVKTITTN